MLGLGAAAALYLAPKGVEERTVHVRFPEAVPLAPSSEVEVAFRRPEEDEPLAVVRLPGGHGSEVTTTLRLPAGPVAVTASVSGADGLRVFAGKVTLDGATATVRVRE